MENINDPHGSEQKHKKHRTKKPTLDIASTTFVKFHPRKEEKQEMEF